MSQAADSAGIPFEGREFRDHPFAGDDGSTPENLGLSLDQIRRHLDGDDDDLLGESATALVEVLSVDRVLVPLIAEAGDIGYTDEGRKVEKSQELSIVTVTGPHGENVGLMFSSVADMAAWREDARPIPVEPSRVAAWALTENVSRVVINPGSTPVTLRRGVLWSMVSDTSYLAPWKTPEVVDAIRAGDLRQQIEGLVDVTVHAGWRLDGGAGPDLIARVWLVPGLERDQLDHITRSLADHWAARAEALALVDGIRLELAVADTGDTPRGA
jgi:hypothetical protein